MITQKLRQVVCSRCLAVSSSALPSLWGGGGGGGGAKWQSALLETKEDLSGHNWKIVDWDVKKQIKQSNKIIIIFIIFINDREKNLCKLLHG